MPQPGERYIAINAVSDEYDMNHDLFMEFKKHGLQWAKPWLHITNISGRLYCFDEVFLLQQYFSYHKDYSSTDTSFLNDYHLNETFMRGKNTYEAQL